MNELIFKGGIGDKDGVGDGEFNSRNYPQGNRIYSDEGLACSQTANGGGIGGKTGLYMINERREYMNNIIVESNYSPSNHNASSIVSDEGIAPTVMGNHGTATGIKQKINKNKGGKIMWNNNLEKFNFKMDKVRVLSLFSGIGAFEESLNYLGIKSEIVNFAEIDIDAIISYGAIHIDDFENKEIEYPIEDIMKQTLMDKNIGYDFAKGKSKIPKLKKDKLYKLYKTCMLGNNLGDVSLVEWGKNNVDLIVGGSPCQDFSIAGKLNGSIWKCNNEECSHEYNSIEQHWSKRECCPKCGGVDLNKTRSSLLVEYLRAIRENKPKYFVYENVKNIKGKGFIDIFNLFEAELKEYGYNTYNNILNSKNYGIPQNRERVFVIGIREDIDNTYEFPIGFDNEIRLKDILEDDVDDKYYINTDRAKLLINKLNEGNYLNSISTPCDSSIMKPKGIDIANCITARYDAGIQNKQSMGVAVAEKISGLFDGDTKHQAGSVWNANNISPTLDTMQGEYREPCVVADTIDNEKNYRIRKLTPLECWRLMGFKDESFYKAQRMGISNSQLYKEAGNSIVVNVLYYIFKELFKKVE